jgi:Sulfotransferase domain
MSFPNSGTSYTIDLIETVSNMSTASNYGPEQKRKGLDTKGVNATTVLPVFSRGPYWRNPLKQHPKSVVLTKTHCGGYCHDCLPSTWIETPHSFLAHCATTDDRPVKDATNGGRQAANRHVYDYKEVTRAVHLIRDPVDNMVARYHLEVIRVTALNQTDMMERYTYDAEGFANLCADSTLDREGHKDSRMDPKVFKLIETIPCHIDLVRYVQWHNLAFLTTQEALNLPTHILYYEDYGSDFEGTLQSLLEFLELPNTGHRLDFQPGKSYHNYFSDDQISRMRTAVMMLALPITWKHLERYF